MKREILFKAKRVDNGEWVEGCSYIPTSSIEFGNIAFWDEGSGMLAFAEVDPKTVCQYLKEVKDGQRLFEGDIFDINQTVNGYSEFVVVSIFPLDIRYNYDHSRQYKYDMHELLDVGNYETEIEVVGNIHD